MTDLDDAKQAFLDTTSGLRAAKITAATAVDLMRRALEAEVHAQLAQEAAKQAYNEAVFRSAATRHPAGTNR